MKRAAHGIRLWLATKLAAIELHRVDETACNPEPTIIKRRRWFSPAAILFGNLYLRFIGAGSFVLRKRAWHNREIAVAGAKIVNGKLCVPILGGVVLYRLLLSSAREELKVNAIQAALGSLFSFQKCHSQTHGDAACENVIIDFDSETNQVHAATWFDFDVAHRDNLKPLDAQADDWRAFAFSCAAVFRAQTSSLAEVCVRAIKDKPLRAAIERNLKSDWNTPNTFQLAQSPLPFDAYHEFLDELLTQLNVTTKEW